MKTARSLSLFGSTLKWIGLSAVALGAFGTASSAVAAIRAQTGWGLSEFELCCRVDEIAYSSP